MSNYPIEPSTEEYISNLIKYSAQEVFKDLGSGHSEAVYESAMVTELGLKHVPVRTQVPCPIYYKHVYLVGTGFIDILVYNRFVIELKAIAKTTSKDVAQVQKYLDYGYKYGFLINFPQGSEEVEITFIGRDKEINDESTSATSRDTDRPLLYQSTNESANPRGDYDSKSTAERSPGDLEDQAGS